MIYHISHVAMVYWKVLLRFKFNTEKSLILTGISSLIQLMNDNRVVVCPLTRMRQLLRHLTVNLNTCTCTCTLKAI